MSRQADGGGGSRPKPPPSIGSALGSAVGGISRSAQKVASQAVRPRNTGGGGSRNRGGGSSGRQPTAPRISTPRPPVGNTPGGTVARSVPPPAPISVEDYLAHDTAYGSQKNAYQKALADYAAQMQAEQGKYNGEYDSQVKQLGLDRTDSLTNLQDDYAGRGLIQSGVYADAMGDMNKKFDTSAADMERARQAYLDDLKTGQTNFSTTQQTLLEKARQDAMNRRLDSLKV